MILFIEMKGYLGLSYKFFLTIFTFINIHLNILKVNSNIRVINNLTRKSKLSFW